MKTKKKKNEKHHSDVINKFKKKNKMKSQIYLKQVQGEHSRSYPSSDTWMDGVYTYFVNPSFNITNKTGIVNRFSIVSLFLMSVH